MRVKKFIKVYLLLSALLITFIIVLNRIDLWPSLQAPIIQEESEIIKKDAKIIFEELDYEIYGDLILVSFNRKVSWEKKVLSGEYRYSIGNNKNDTINIAWVIENGQIVIKYIKMKYDDNYIYNRE